MKKRIMACLLCAAMILTMLPSDSASAAPEDGEDSSDQVSALADETDLGTNVALKAVAGASYTNEWYISTTAMNDGELADSDSSTSWNNWGSYEDTVTVSLTWDTEYVLTGMRVIWWADNDEVQFPSDCRL